MSGFSLVVFGVQGSILLLTFWDQGTIGGYPVRPPSDSDGQVFPCRWAGAEVRNASPAVSTPTSPGQLKVGEAKVLDFFPLNLEKVQVSKCNLEKDGTFL